MTEQTWRAKEAEDRRQGHCGADYGDCYSSRCCANMEYGCYKQPTSMYAQCRPYSWGHCRSTDEWLCPDHWLSCARVGTNCIEQRCCQNPELKCFHKENQFAQCLPSCTPDMQVAGDNSHRPWTCKEMSMPPPPPLPPPLPPPPPPSPSPPPPGPSSPPPPRPPADQPFPPGSPPSPLPPPPMHPPMLPEWWCAAGRKYVAHPCASLTDQHSCDDSFFIHLHRLAGTGGDLWLCQWTEGRCDADKTGCLELEEAQRMRDGLPPKKELASPPPPSLSPAPGPVAKRPDEAGPRQDLARAFGELVAGVTAILLCLRCACTRVCVGRGARIKRRAAAGPGDNGDDEDFGEEDEDGVELEDFDSDDEREVRRGRHGRRRGRMEEREPRSCKRALRDHDEED